MKKLALRRLALTRETVRLLDDLRPVTGAAIDPTGGGSLPPICKGPVSASCGTKAGCPPTIG